MRRSIVLGALVVSVAWLAVTAGPALGQSNGTVTATVQVQAAACITISPTSFTYAPAQLSTTAGLVTTTPNSTKPTVTSCSTATQNYLARGGTATGGGGASWQLANSVDCGVPDIDKYRHEIKPETSAYFPLSTTDQTWESGVVQSATRLVDTRLTMPCTGSSGVGTTMSMPIFVTAVVP
jgi:hypothetical protein